MTTPIDGTYCQVSNPDKTGNYQRNICYNPEKSELTIRDKNINNLEEAREIAEEDAGFTVHNKGNYDKDTDTYTFLATPKEENITYTEPKTMKPDVIKGYLRQIKGKIDNLL